MREHGRFVPDFVFKKKSGKICIHSKCINMKGCVQNIPIKFKQFAVYLFSNFYRICYFRVSGQAVQPVPLASLKLSMAVYGQKLDGRPSR